MSIRTILIVAAGVFALAAFSLTASIAGLGAGLELWPSAWRYAGEALMITTLVGALVWSTGLALRREAGGLPTGALAWGLGVAVLVATSLLTEFTIWPVWNALGLPVIDPMLTRHDLAWVSRKIIECAVYVLPFAAWRGFQRRGGGVLTPATE